METSLNTPYAGDEKNNRKYVKDQVVWPKRAVVTAGMPYGNKPLHFGHIGGVFVPADAFARFLRDRIGEDNVRFVCGTDCFGSPITESYRKLVEAGEFSGSVCDYVTRNHEAQKHTLESYGISLSVFEGSGIGHCGEVHQRVSERFIKKLYDNGFLHLDSTLQFYDTKAKTFLNGRQVQGHCPVQGCKSEHGYADECDLGHQYAPADLISPISSVTGSVPEMRPVKNWYFDLPAFAGFLKDYVAALASDDEVRDVVVKTIEEFLAPPVVYIKCELEQTYRACADELPAHVFRAAEAGKQSFEIEFETIGARDEARVILAQNGIRFRTGKTLVPFRITGNIEWGVKAPVIEGLDNLTVWCWPESLWAPISFTMAVNDKLGLPSESWRDFWCSEDAQVYQFIGQDNLYFYGVAQPALIEALLPGDFMSDDPAAQPLRQTKLIANHHVLFGNKKASSSGAVKPPSADELLNHYTPEQLRAHFLALGLDQKSVGFKPKPYDVDLAKRDDPRVADPVLKEGTLLTNVYNRLARSCFYEAGKNFENMMPVCAISAEVIKRAHETMHTYESLMHKVELHSVMSLMDEFIRYANKYWTDNIRSAEQSGDMEVRRQVLADSFYLLRITTLLMHPIAPFGTELVCEYFELSADEFFSWGFDFDGMGELCTEQEVLVGAHRVRELPPRFDFFKKHESQLR